MLINAESMRVLNKQDEGLSRKSYDPPDVIGLDKNTVMPLANSKTITDDITLTLP